MFEEYFYWTNLLFIIVSFSISFILFLYYIFRLFEGLKGGRNKLLFFSVGSVLIALFIRLFMVSGGHMQFLDEFYYMEEAKNFLR